MHSRFLAILAGLLSTGTVGAADVPVDFARDIRPILTEYCFHCHGPDEKTRKADLRLDTRDGLTASTKDVLARVTSTDAEEVMPPPKLGKKPTASQIATLRKWVEQGGKWSAHWAFEPPVRPVIPQLRTPNAGIRTPIDAFILARLEKDGRAFSPEAAKETLIRRLSLDLTGLPPTPKEVDDFVNDPSANAYEKVVDRLFASPHYGERMAMPWLDAARFADSNGFQTDTSRQMWPWRDWVIRAFNENLPYDQFTIQQIAGDMLPNATRSQIVATGFNRNHRLNGEGGIIGEEWRIETVIDRVETTGLTWLGLTVGCARCHDHKYDPITQKEFYRLFAFFNNVPESGTLTGNRSGGNSDPVELFTTPEHEVQLAKLQRELTDAEAKVAAAVKTLPERLAAWEPGFRAELTKTGAVWTGFAPKSVTSSGGATFTKQDDGTYLASGKNPPHDVYTITGTLNGGTFSGLLLECFPDASLPVQSLGRYPNGNFVLTGVEAEITATGQAPQKLKITRADADYSQNGWDIKNVLNSNPKTGWAVDGPTKKEPRRALFTIDSPVSVPANATLTVRLKHDAIDRHNIGRFRLSTTGLPPATVTLTGQRIPDAVRQALETDAAKRTPAQKTALTNYHRTAIDGQVKQAESTVAAVKKQITELQAMSPSVMVMKEGSPRDAFILVRGQYDKPGEKVTPGLPAALPPLPVNEPLNRLGFARWIASPTNPLTARVWVNRAWEKFFGTGLVKSTENFGTQAEFPSHPELLDWLATEFVRLGWDMKAMQKLIVMSAAYRQSSRVTPELLAHDPENRLLARGPRFRLTGELVRDQALAASGLLVPRIGGPSARPYMPAGVWDETSRYGDLRNYQADAGDGLYRRTMYTVWKRTAAPPTMLIFDAPNREVCTVKRSRTNTPLQALALLNEVTYVEAARKLAERMLTEGGTTPTERLTYGFRLVTARKPTPSELAVLLEGLANDQDRFAKSPDAVKKLLAFGTSKPLATANPAELAAFTLSANVLLNLDETVSRE